ncbi:protein Star isoform X2 [Plodia interpunctella]|uniref:protein Star isoform X2 n=1 Tax=Plodia interpunctella TaxID=58824 RepID=UPI0023685687|nr:protein Star isoform X2 [Plodia interpunctella]
MAEKKIQENPLPEAQTEPAERKDMAAIPVPYKPSSPATAPAPAPHVSVPTFTKAAPNDLYRRLLPAVLFVLTFVTVMTMLLIYMDTVALGAQQFRVNMSRDYELARIPAESPALVAFVRQLHLAPRAPLAPPAPPAPPQAPPRSVRVLDALYGPIENGTFVDVQPSGGAHAGCAWLRAARAWRGLSARAAPRDFLALRGARALHACLSLTAHPREVTFPEPESQSAAFSSRVLCLPLVTILLAADALDADYVVLAGDVLPALAHVPFGDGRLRLKVIEVRSQDPWSRNQTTQFLQNKNYTVAAEFSDAVMYALKV